MVTVDTKGRIVLPSEVREQLGLGPGSEVAVTATNDQAIVEPETNPDQLMRDLEAKINEAAANRERRRETDTEEQDQSLDTDPIAEHHRESIRRGAARTKPDTDDSDT